MRTTENTTSHYKVMVKNKPGELAKVTKLLADSTIFVNGLNIANLGDTACIQFSTPKDCGLKDGLLRMGLRAELE